MSYFQWAEDMAIDHGPIDEDHKKLIAHVNLLHTATSEGRGQEMVAMLLKELIYETSEHIHQEEHQMAILGYPHLEQHKVGHVQFMEELYKLQAKQTAGNATVASQLSMLLRDWLSVHIRRFDKDLHRFLQEKERAARLRPGATPKRRPSS